MHIIAAGLIIALSVTTYAWWDGYKKLEDEAAKTSCAQYNPETGKFEWTEVKP